MLKMGRDQGLAGTRGSRGGSRKSSGAFWAHNSCPPSWNPHAPQTWTNKERKSLKNVKINMSPPEKGLSPCFSCSCHATLLTVGREIESWPPKLSKLQVQINTLVPQTHHGGESTTPLGLSLPCLEARSVLLSPSRTFLFTSLITRLS